VRNLDSGPLAVVTGSTPRLRVLVLDGQHGHALAAIRSLGRRGAFVAVASHRRQAMGFASRFCSAALHTPAPGLESAAYVDWLLETLRHGRYDATLCFAAHTADLVNQHRDRVQKLTGCPMPARDIFLAADRKDRVTRLGRQIGVPVPFTYELERIEDAAGIARAMDFPVVVKGVRGSRGQQVEIVRKPAELMDAVRRVAALRRDVNEPLPIVQEYIEGRGYGLTALVRRGEPIAVFMHKLLAEHDVRRGTRWAHGAVGAQSVEEPELRHSGLAVLQALCWDGIAMVEFRRSSRDGRFYLMEVNPRFAGSLDLAIAAGIDFPWLYSQWGAGRPILGPNRYRVGLRYRWILSKSMAPARENPVRFAFGTAAALLPGTRTDLTWRDLGPHWQQLRNVAAWARDSRRQPERQDVAAGSQPAPPPPAGLYSERRLESVRPEPVERELHTSGRR
jgi:predicted ATP-grasp superfamily ATP-dependent carboligase